jgi:hypothetical protein
MEPFMSSRSVLMLCAGVLGASLVAPAALAEPGGCLKYGAVGGVGGHLAHHGVLGAVGGCATGMYVRHEYRKEARQKAALWDQEHPGDKRSYANKAAAYDAEHNTQPGQMNAAPAPAGQAPAHSM